MTVIDLAAKRSASDPEMVAIAERLLKWAKEGSLHGLGYTSVRDGRVVGTGWHITEASKCSHELLSGCSMLQYRLNEAQNALPDAGEPE